jgi:hypothetical protein
MYPPDSSGDRTDRQLAVSMSNHSLIADLEDVVSLGDYGSLISHFETGGILDSG